MTELGDVEDDAGATSRRRLPREGSALMGGAVLAGGLADREAVAATVNGHPDLLESLGFGRACRWLCHGFRRACWGRFCPRPRWGTGVFSGGQ
jgi:hypothetical protein